MSLVSLILFTTEMYDLCRIFPITIDQISFCLPYLTMASVCRDRDIEGTLLILCNIFPAEEYSRLISPGSRTRTYSGTPVSITLALPLTHTASGSRLRTLYSTSCRLTVQIWLPLSCWFSFTRGILSPSLKQFVLSCNIFYYFEWG